MRGGPHNDVWSTPSWLFDPLHARLRFDLDCAADARNAKCRRFFDEQANALAQCWDARCWWANVPYGRQPGTGEWVGYARHQVEQLGNQGCLLIPVKAETEWYQDLVWGRNDVIASRKILDGPIRGRWYRLREPGMLVELLELRARVSFGDGSGNGWFASALVLYNAPRARGRGLLDFST